MHCAWGDIEELDAVHGHGGSLSRARPRATALDRRLEGVAEQMPQRMARHAVPAMAAA